MRDIIPKKYAVALYQLIKDADKAKSSEITKSFVATLIKNKDVNKIDKIIDAFSQYYNQQENRIKITITTASEITEQLEGIESKLKDNFGKDIELISKVDPKIIGGIILKYGDNVADGSIRRKVQLLAKSLK